MQHRGKRIAGADCPARKIDLKVTLVSFASGTMQSVIKHFCILKFLFTPDIVNIQP